MTDFTQDELVLISEVVYSAQDYGYAGILADAEQGVFTQQTIDDMVAKAPTYEYPHFAEHIMALANDLEGMGQVMAAPPPFTADEMTQMNFLVAHNTAHANVEALLSAAEHVGFWSDTQLADLEALASPDRNYVGHHSQAAVVGLVDDLTAGGQILHHG